MPRSPLLLLVSLSPCYPSPLVALHAGAVVRTAPGTGAWPVLALSAAPAGVVDAASDPLLFVADGIPPLRAVRALSGVAWPVRDGGGYNAPFCTGASALCALAMDVSGSGKPYGAPLLFAGDCGRFGVTMITLSPSGRSASYSWITGGGTGVCQAGYRDGEGQLPLFASPRAVALDTSIGPNLHSRVLFVADTANAAVRSVKVQLFPGFTPTFPIALTIAGGGGGGGGASAPGAVIDGTGTNAIFGAPAGLFFDAALRRLFVADAGFSLIRVVQLPEDGEAPIAIVSTLAGGATGASAGGHSDGTGYTARFAAPWAFAVGDDGGGGGGDVNRLLLVVTEARNFKLRTIDVCNDSVTVTTLAGGMGAQLRGIADGFGTAAGFSAPLSATLLRLNGSAAIVVADASSLRIVTPGNCSDGGGDGGSEQAPPCAVAPLPGAHFGSLALPFFAAAAIVSVLAAYASRRARAVRRRRDENSGGGGGGQGGSGGSGGGGVGGGGGDGGSSNSSSLLINEAPSPPMWLPPAIARPPPTLTVPTLTMPPPLATAAPNVGQQGSHMYLGARRGDFVGESLGEAEDWQGGEEL